MTIEEAIEHCREIAKESREAALSYARENAYETAISCKACGQEHEQLAEWLTELKQRREAEITEQPKSNDEHTAAYWMQKTMDAAHEAYDKLKDTADFKNAIAEAEAIKQRMGIGETKKLTNGDRIRQMTDEELAELFGKCADCQMCIDYPSKCKMECIDGYMQWLKQEAIEDAES